MLTKTLPIFLLLLIVSCSRNENSIYHRAFYIMGSSLELKFYTNDEKLFYKITDESLERAKEIDHLFSNYKDDSVLAEVNSKSGKQAVTVPYEFIELTQTSINYSRKTGGAFDITVGNLFKLWKESVRKSRPPDPTELQKANECTGYEKIKIDNNKISFLKNCIELDFGAIGKGYVVDEIIRIARSYGVKNGLINFGGNIYALGTPYDSDAWDVGINDPDHPGKIISNLSLKNYGTATSGDYEKFFEIDGKRYSHIIDPATGFPVEEISSVTVIAKSAMEADVYSTAFSVLGVEKTKKFIENNKQIGVMFVTKQKDKTTIFKSDLFEKLDISN